MGSSFGKDTPKAAQTKTENVINERLQALQEQHLGKTATTKAAAQVAAVAAGTIDAAAN